MNYSSGGLQTGQVCLQPTTDPDQTTHEAINQPAGPGPGPGLELPHSSEAEYKRESPSPETLSTCDSYDEDLVDC